VLHDLKTGDRVVKNVIANVTATKGDPLLGQSFLSKLPYWTIDSERHALILYDVPRSLGQQSTNAKELIARADAAYAREHYAMPKL
jgi:hypothetical protein